MADTNNVPAVRCTACKAQIRVGHAYFTCETCLDFGLCASCWSIDRHTWTHPADHVFRCIYTGDEMTAASMLPRHDMPAVPEAREDDDLPTLVDSPRITPRADAHPQTFPSGRFD
jgi:hypothetical protein